MKKWIAFILLFHFGTVNAQTGIGTTTPDASAKLDVSATNKGFLPPRVTLTSVTDNSTISNPANGLLIYNTGNNVGLAAGYYFWNGNAWATIATAGGSGSFAASFLRGSRTATQSLAVGGIVGFSVLDNTAGQDISLNTANGKITLLPGNTYRLIAAVPNFSGGQRPAFMWYNETSASYVGSATSTYNPGDAAALAASGGVAHVIITPNVTTVLSFRLLSSLNSGTVTVGANADFSLAGSYPWFEAQVIAGNAPVTGQSVDYVSVMLTTDQSNSTAGQNVKFQTVQSGNIPYDPTTGNFTLTGGKTYRLTALASLNGTSPAASALDITWRNADGVNLGPLGSLIGSSSNINFSGQGVVDVIYTPTRNITVSLYIGFVSNSTTVLRSYATNATITQIGSSAIVNPWTLAGNDTYNTLGKVGIGNTTPTQALDVTGNVRTSGNYMYTDGSSTAKKVSGYVNAGTFIAFENIQATVTTSGNRGLSVAAVSTPFYCNIGATYGALGGGSGNSIYNYNVTTAASTSWFAWHFANAGDYSTYIVNDTTNNRVYRITMTIGAAYFNNFILIERLN